MAHNSAEAPVITALSVLTPFGVGLEALLSGLATGAPLPSPATCPQLDVREYLPSEKTYLDRCSELALVGASLALREGQVDLPTLDLDRVGLGLGTAYGCLDTMFANTSRVQTKGARLASPLLFMHSFVNAPASLIAIEWGLRGPGATFTDSALSFASALLWASDLLRRGSVDLMLVGGVDALSAPLLQAVAADATLADCLPPAEAACFLLLERAEHAADRGGVPRAVLQDVHLGPAPPGRCASPDLPFHAFGAHFGLQLALAAAEASATTSGAVVTLSLGAAGRSARAVLAHP